MKFSKMILLTVSALSLSLGLTLCACNGQNPDTGSSSSAGAAGTVFERSDLKNWDDETKEVSLFDTYRLSVYAAYDHDGNAYRVTPTVKQTDGKSVNVLNNEFSVDFAGGYEITYTLSDAGISAPIKTIRLKVQGSDTPFVYFEKSQVVFYDDEANTLPAYACLIDPTVGIRSTDIKLERIEGDSRVMIESDLTKAVDLEEGNYEYTVKVVATNGQESSGVLPFRVRSSAERNAIASFNDPNFTSLYVSYWDNSIYSYNATTATFTKDVYRNEKVSLGSYEIVAPKEASVLRCRMIPEINEANFVKEMNKEGAVFSMWVCMKADDGMSRSMSFGSKSTELKNGVWTNVTMSLEDSGYADARAFFKALSLGSLEINVFNTNTAEYSLYFDSMYVALPITATFGNASCKFGEKVTLQAQNDSNAEFYYELYDGTSANSDIQVSETGEFKPRVAGTLRAMAYPVSNAYYSDSLMATVTVKGEKDFAFTSQRISLAFGENDRPSASFGSSVAASATYSTESLSGGESFIRLYDDKISVYPGEYILSAEYVDNGTTYTAYSLIIGGKATTEIGDIETFDDPSSLKNLDDASAFTYVGDYKGATGVVKMVGMKTYQWPGFGLRSSATDIETLKANFTNDDYLAIRLCVDKLPNSMFFFLNVLGKGAYADENNIVDYNNETHYILDSEWHTYYIKASLFFNNVDAWFNADANENQKATFRFSNNNLNDGEVYIDWIKLVKASEIN